MKISHASPDLGEFSLFWAENKQNSLLIAAKQGNQARAAFAPDCVAHHTVSERTKVLPSGAPYARNRAVLRGFAGSFGWAWVRAPRFGSVSAPISANVSVWIFLASPGGRALQGKMQVSPRTRAALPVRSTTAADRHRAVVCEKAVLALCHQRSPQRCSG